MKNIHVLPTDKPSRLSKDENDRIWLSINFEYGINDNNKQNIFITSDEKFNRDEYVTDGVEVIKATPKLVDAQGLVDRRDWKKIILTTDQDLIKDGVQAIEDNFLEWFVKNPDCEEVEILIINGGYDKPEDVPYQECYEIIIPKQETKQERMYSEEEVYNLLEEAIKDNYIFELDYHNSGDYRNLKEWFEQFKNK